MINIRTKGQEGEREIARDLNDIINDIHRELGLPLPEKPVAQRNQNQSAAGGCDLSNTFDLAIEIKRQEQLSINSWWTQCIASAKTLGHEPVLLFRQNTKPGQRKMWRCMLYADLPCSVYRTRVEITYDDFKIFFRKWAHSHLSEISLLGEKPSVVTSLAVIEAVPTRERFLPDLFAAV